MSKERILVFLSKEQQAFQSDLSFGKDDGADHMSAKMCRTSRGLCLASMGSSKAGSA